MTSLCVICTRREAAVGLSCWRCHDRLVDMLDVRNTGSRYNPTYPDAPYVPPSIPVLYAALDATPGSTGPAEVIASAGFGSRSPANDHVVSLRDARTRARGEGPDDNEGQDSPVRILWELVCALSTTGHPNANDVSGLASHLHSHLNALVRSPHVRWMHEQLRRLSSTLRAAQGDAPPSSVGSCQVLVDGEGHEDRDGAWRCAVPLYVPSTAPRGPDEPLVLPSLRCSGCGHRYTGVELVALGKAREEAA